MTCNNDDLIAALWNQPTPPTDRWYVERYLDSEGGWREVFAGWRVSEAEARETCVSLQYFADAGATANSEHTTQYRVNAEVQS